MKSVCGMIVVFIGLYIVAYSDILGFFAHKTVYHVVLGLVIFMLLLAVAVIGTPFNKPLIKRKKRGGNDDKIDQSE